MVVAVIPSRYQSSRFPGKPLVAIAGVPLIARVVRRVLEAGVADRVLCATDDARAGEDGRAFLSLLRERRLVVEAGWRSAGRRPGG